MVFYTQRVMQRNVGHVVGVFMIGFNRGCPSDNDADADNDVLFRSGDCSNELVRCSPLRPCPAQTTIRRLQFQGTAAISGSLAVVAAIR